MMKRWIWIVASLLTLFPPAAEASCSGSGLSWTCTAGSTATQVNTAVGSATNGATITFATGTYTGTGFHPATTSGKGVSFVCASEGGCTFSSSGDVVTIDTCGADISTTIRVSGFVFSGLPSTGAIWFYCSDGFNLTGVRIDHNTFSNFGGTQAVFFGETSSSSLVYGVVDHNTFTSSTNGMAFKNVSGGDVWTTGRRGTVNNAFFEDNSISFTANNNLGLSAFDGYDAGGTVIRFNTLRGSRFEQHSLCHPGMTNFEVYGNDISDTVTGGQAANNYRNIHSQGSGEFTVWGNKIDNSGTGGGSALAVQHYRSDATQLPQGDCATTEVCNGTFVAASGVPQTDGNRSGQVGYPCWHQPGRDAAGTLKPLYFWSNLNTGGALVPLSVESGDWTGLAANCANNNNNRIDCHLQTDRDIYQAVSASAQTSATSPFNGTTGMGFGTLANRPTTCTATPSAADAGAGGVAYWATDQGSWNTSSTNPYGVQQNGADGVLYRCSATNTWTTDYTPYTYPHPLQGGGGGGGNGPSAKRLRLRIIKRGGGDAALLLSVMPVWWRWRRRAA